MPAADLLVGVLEVVPATLALSELVDTEAVSVRGADGSSQTVPHNWELSYPNASSTFLGMRTEKPKQMQLVILAKKHFRNLSV